MKEKVLSVALLIGVIFFTAINTVMLNEQIKAIEGNVSSLDTSNEDAQKLAEDIYKEFQDRSSYMSLTVSHEDIRDIEDQFVEMIGYLTIGDGDSAKVTRNRLIRSLEHLRRLSGFNIDAII